VTCLQRQIAGDIAGGPDDYDSANALVESALLEGGNFVQCKDMLTSHTGLGITDAQFEALDLHAATALTLLLGDPAAGTKGRAIIDAVVAALTGTQICKDIVEIDGAGAEDECHTGRRVSAPSPGRVPPVRLNARCRR
jgi:hypothetical protein